MNIVTEIAYEHDSWNKYPEINEELITLFITKILTAHKNFATGKEFELSLLLTDDKNIKSLNQRFRNKDSATDVLSFPDTEINWPHILEFKVDLNYMYLGDIAFNYQSVLNGANERNINFMDHFKHLLVHAILHLIGYDHIKEEEAEAMEALEIKILKSFNIPSPY